MQPVLGLLQRHVTGLYAHVTGLYTNVTGLHLHVIGHPLDINALCAGHKRLHNSVG